MMTGAGFPDTARDQEAGRLIKSPFNALRNWTKVRDALPARGSSQPGEGQTAGTDPMDYSGWNLRNDRKSCCRSVVLAASRDADGARACRCRKRSKAGLWEKIRN